MSDFSRFRLVPLLLAGFLVAGCSDGPAADDDSLEQAEYEGLSREQIESEASMMTIEEAESLGIVDTTIRVVPPMDPDSVGVLPLDNPIVPIDSGTTP